MVRPYVFLEVLTKIKVVRHLIRPPMIFFPGYNAQGLTSYSQKTKWIHEKYVFLQTLADCHEGIRQRKNTLSITFERPSFLQYTTLNIFLVPRFWSCTQLYHQRSKKRQIKLSFFYDFSYSFRTVFRPLVLK